LGIGDWGLGIGDWAQSPIPNPQSPIPNPHFIDFIHHILFKYNLNIIKIINNIFLISEKIIFFKNLQEFHKDCPFS